MRAFKVVLTALFVLSSLAFAPPEAAMAVDPPGTAMVVRESYGFETAYPADWKVTKHPYPLAGTVSSFIWGREYKSKHSGGYGLWCAAAYASGGAYSWYYPNYPKDTAGRATLTLDQLDQYYSAELQFWWKMPSRGAADDVGFSVNWGPLGTTVDNNPSQWAGYAYFPVSSTWQLAKFDLTKLSLSRRDGEVQFNFRNWIEGGSQFPAQGEGPTIDDVVVYGYKYGPVRSLAAAQTSSGNSLTWSRPYRAVGSTTVEDRSIAYRVWRTLASQPTGPWTEITTSRITDTATAVEYTDTTSVSGVAYTYRVIAYDTGTGTGYGQSTEVTIDPPTVDIAVTASVNPASIAVGDSATFTYRVQNTGEVELSSIGLSDNYGAVTSGVPASLAPGAFFETARTVSPGESMTNSVVVQGTGDGITRTKSTDVSLTVSSPGILVTASALPTEIAEGQSTTFSYLVQNTGDATLSSLVLSDGYGAISAGVPSSLAPDETFTVTRLVSPTASLTNTATVSGIGGGSTVQSQHAASVVVRHPSLGIVTTVDPASIVSGSSATWTYTVTNTGDVSLGTVALTDGFGAVTTGVPATLAPGASFVAERTAAPTDSVLNEATVSGSALGATVQASDSAFLQVKAASAGLDVTATVSPGTVAEGDSATFTYEVRNTGNVAISGLAVADDLGPITAGIPLDPDATILVTRVASPTSSLLNAVNVSGMAGAVPVSASDSAYLEVTHPAIGVTSAVSPSTIAAGSSATFTYNVTNTGDVTLTGLTLTDDFGALSTDVPASLAPGASYQVQRVATPASTFTNDVTAGGTGTGKAVSNGASSSVTVTNPAVQLAASVSPSAVPEGTPATFTYRITNSGDVTLGSISVSDAIGPLTSGVPATLASGAYFEVTRVASPPSSLSPNTISVSAAATGKTVTATKDVNLTVTHPSATVKVGVNKTPSLLDEQLDFTYTVVNTGDTTLSGVTLEDEWGSVSGVPSTLAPEASFVAYRLNQTPPAGTLTNVATLSGTATGVTKSWGTGSATVVVINPAMSLSVTPAERGVLSGKSAEYEATVKNTGTVALTEVEVNASVVGAAGSDGASIGSLAVGETKHVTLLLPVTGTVGATYNVNFSADYSYGAGTPWAGNKTKTAAAKVSIMGDRVFGSNRIDTAIEASKDAFPTNGSADCVVIATGYGFPDALSAAGLAGAGNGPLLLVDGKASTLPSAVKSEIVRLGPSRVYIVGGTSVVSTGIESGLRSLASSAGFSLRPRLAGTNRYHTAQLVAQEVKALGGNTGTVFLATGLNFPDALAASSLAARMGSPILLTETNTLPPQTDAALRSLRPSRVVVCGGTGAVSAGVVSSISGKSIYGSPTIVRMDGTNRYHTAQLIVQWGVSASGGNLAPDGIDGLYLATGENYPDALAGGVLAGIGGAQWRPLVLTMSESLVPQAKSVITSNPTAGFVSAVGGEGVLSATVVTAAKNLL